jgi:uncharacterized membrane protein YqhA
MRRVLSATRYLILLAVIGSFIGAITLLAYGFAEAMLLPGKAIEMGIDGKFAKKLMVDYIEIVDLFLVGTIFYIVALGLYELFIDDKIPTPEWLHITNLDDLKGKLVGVIVVVMGVIFLAQLVSWDGSANLLPFGAAIAVVVAALTWFARRH